MTTETLPKQIQEQKEAIDKFYDTPSEQPELQEEPIKESEDWEKRFKNYKSKTDLTIHELRTQAQKINEISEENNQLKSRLESLKELESKPPQEILNHFTEEEAAVVSKLVEQKTKEMVSKVKMLEGKLAGYEEGLNQTKQEQAQKTLYELVSSRVPGFDKIDTNPAFKKFLNEPDDFGNIRYNILNQAKASGDVARIVTLYNEFGSKLNPGELKQVPSSSPTKPSSEPNGRVWDNNTIKQFYKDKALGIIPSDEAAELEKEMFSFLNS